MKKILFVVIIMMTVSTAHAQLGNFLKRQKERLQQKAEDKINQKTEAAVDSALEGKPKTKETKSSSTTTANNKAEVKQTSNVSATSSAKADPEPFKAYSKYDFIPGEKVMAVEEFTNDNIGDFPVNWNTNSSGEIVTIGGRQGKWLAFTKPGTFLPEQFKSFPENFTLEFDVACNEQYSYYSSPFFIGFAQLQNPGKDFQQFGPYNTPPTCVITGLFGMDAANYTGGAIYKIIKNNEYLMDQSVSTDQFSSHPGENVAHVALWRQKGRLRMYVNQDKVLDLPKAFDAATIYNTLVMYTTSYFTPEDKFFVSNLRLAVGAPDTRTKLITEGKVSTNGILFDFQSDKIKPESYAVIKDIANVLNENPNVRVKIVGHTSNDGEPAANLQLSKQRAESVKQNLISVFNIAANRLETDGKGGNEPADKANTPEAKANNRRVEFIKL